MVSKQDTAAAAEAEFAAYLPGIRRRWLEQQATWERRREAAWETAQRAAAVLREQFGAQRVYAFGSVIQPGYFDDRSDVDLAVSGIAPAEFFRAWAAAAADSPFEIDLVDLADCSPKLRQLVLKEGVPV